MKRLLFFFLSLWLASLIQAQRPYQPMVVEGATWVYVELTGGCSSSSTRNEKYRMHWIGEDTLINNLVYHKYYRTDAEREFDAGIWNYRPVHDSRLDIDLIREDSSLKKVYIQIDTFPEFLMYDFDYEQKDTVLTGWNVPFSFYLVADTVFYWEDIPYNWLYAYNGDPNTIMLPDSIRIIANDNAMRFDPNRFCVGQMLMEGIGPNDEWGRENTNLIFYCRDSAQCVERILTSSKSKSDVNILLKIFPNPTSEYINLQVDHLTSITKVVLVSLSGQPVQTWLIPPTDRGHIHLNLQPQVPGLYLLQLSTSNDHKHFKRLIIH